MNRTPPLFLGFVVPLRTAASVAGRGCARFGFRNLEFALRGRTYWPGGSLKLARVFCSACFSASASKKASVDSAP